jgi:hypothetical protein
MEWAATAAAGGHAAMTANCSTGVLSLGAGCHTAMCPTGSEPPGVLAKNAKD